MAFVCEQFRLNAWKKDFCSNCFKSRIEHQIVKSLPLDNHLTPKKSTIRVKDVTDKAQFKRNVSFCDQLVEIIGIGGDDDYSDNDFECDEYLNDSIDSYDVIDNDDGVDPEFIKITKINTDINSGRKDILSLGVQSEEKKRPLAISIRPFGGDGEFAAVTEMQERKKLVSLNRQDAFIREKPMTYQTKSLKINYLSKSVNDNLTSTIEVVADDVEVQPEASSDHNDDSKVTEIDELSSISSMEDFSSQTLIENNNYKVSEELNHDKIAETDSCKTDSDNSSVETEMPSPPPRKPRLQLNDDQIKVSASDKENIDNKSGTALEEDDEKLLVHAGSESDSEIYAQYSFCSSENETSGYVDDEEDNESDTRRAKDESVKQQNSRLKFNNLRSHKGCSVVHKTLEDNYGAIVVANHEALIHVMDNMCPYPVFSTNLQILKTINELHFNDFSTIAHTAKSIIGNYMFLKAIYTKNQQKVTLMMSQQPPTSILTLGQSSSPTVTFEPIVEFSDQVNVSCLSDNKEPENLRQMKISVLPPLEIIRLLEYKQQRLVNERDSNESILIILQFINVLKILQAHGIEKVSDTLQEFILCKSVEERNEHNDELIVPKLIILPNCFNDDNDDKPLKSLCESARFVLADILPFKSHPIQKLLTAILEKEHSSSLTQAKSLLEYYLWGPMDINFVSLSLNTFKEREISLKHWLDLERATVLNGLVRNKSNLSIIDQFHLMFLVRTSAKAMSEASLLFES